MSFYSGVYLTDLTFVDEGNPEIIPPNLINFRKKQLEYDVIVQVLKFQETPYQLKYVSFSEAGFKISGN
jgi:son of sevenless